MFDAFLDQLRDAANGLGANMADVMINGAKAAAIALAAIVVARWLQKRVRESAQRARLDGNTPALLGNLATIAVYVIAAALIFSTLGGNFTAGVTLISAATVAVSLALQDILRSLVAGIYLLIERPFSIGQRIEVDGVEGVVANIDMRTTQLITDHGGAVFVPNSTVFGSIVTNRSTGLVPRLLVTVNGLPLDDPDLAATLPAVASATAGVHPRARVQRIERTPAGMSLVIEIAYDPGTEPANEVAERIHGRFPEATVIVERPAA